MVVNGYRDSVADHESVDSRRQVSGVNQRWCRGLFRESLDDGLAAA